ncbi:right-handed parallel beta-helix repeat-containing protein, partial [Pseudomonas syringae group genomosp. 7]
EVTGVPQQPENHLNHEAWGIWNNVSHTVFERLNLHHNMGPGLFIHNGGYNQVLNTDSHHNYDHYPSNGAGQSAEGFGAHM